MCVCVRACVRSHVFVCNNKPSLLLLSAETYEDFDSRVIEVSASQAASIQTQHIFTLLIKARNTFHPFLIRTFLALVHAAVRSGWDLVLQIQTGATAALTGEHCVRSGFITHYGVMMPKASEEERVFKEIKMVKDPLWRVHIDGDGGECAEQGFLQLSIKQQMLKRQTVVSKRSDRSC